MIQTVSTVTTLKAPLRETLMFVNYHLNMGVSHMYLFFDDPNDDCIEALANYKQVTCIKCDSEHWENILSQSGALERDWTTIESSELQRMLNSSVDYRQILNANYAFKLAQRDGSDWLIHIDSDELIYAKESLDVLLSKVSPKTEVLVIKPLETAPEKTEYESIFDEVTLFKNIPWLWQKYLAYFLGCQRVFQDGYYFRAHHYGKSAVRTNAKIKSIDIHYPVAARGHRLRAKKFWGTQLLHFDCCGFDSWQRKWMRRYDGIGSAAEDIPRRYKQLSKFAEAYESGDINRLYDLYRQFYFFSSYEHKVLSLLGLLQRIQLNPKLFEYYPAANISQVQVKS